MSKKKWECPIDGHSTEIGLYSSLRFKPENEVEKMASRCVEEVKRIFGDQFECAPIVGAHEGTVHLIGLVAISDIVPDSKVENFIDCLPNLVHSIREES